jgi:ABC-type transport system involved in cytochrome bd biosynthesis fused ATPase/permease subunit
MQTRRLALSLILAASPLFASGCFLVAAGAGAAGAIAYTNRGATSVVAGTVDQVFDRAVAAFQQAAITETGRSTEDSGRLRKIIGTKGEYEVTAELNRTTDSTTKVEITARKSAVEYDKELAKDILNRVLTAPNK